MFTHLEYTAVRGLVHDVPYATWLLNTHAISAQMNSDDLFASAILGGLEALSGGVTCLADITPTGAALQALRQLGMRGVIYREVGAMDKRRVDHAIAQAIADIERWTAAVADNDKIEVGIAPAALYTCHPTVFSRISEYAGSKVPVALHVAGSREEYRFIRDGASPLSVDRLSDRRGFVEVPPWLPTGVTPVNYVLNWGGFDAANVLAIHAIHVSDDDILKLKDYDVAIGHCPRCNAQLGMGVAPISEYLRAGMRVGLGTDSPAATDSSDMVVEMRTGMLVQRAVNSQEFITAQTMLEMATIGGARALRMEDKIGSLEVGKRADIIAIDLAGSHQTPTKDPVGAVVNTTMGADVIMTMVDGSVLYEQNQWHVDADVAKSIAHVIEVRGKLRA